MFHEATGGVACGWEICIALLTEWSIAMIEVAWICFNVSPVWVSQILVRITEFMTFDVYFRQLRSLVEEKAINEVATSDRKSSIRAVSLSSVRVALEKGVQATTTCGLMWVLFLNGFSVARWGLWCQRLWWRDCVFCYMVNLGCSFCRDERMKGRI